MPLASVDVLTSVLLVEQRRLDPARYLSGGGPHVPRPERPLVAAAACVAAGSPKQAIRGLDGVEFTDESARAVAEALRRGARALDTNWFPGDQRVVIGDEVPEYGAPVEIDDADAALVCLLAGGVIPTVLFVRAALSNALPGDTSGAVAQVLGESEQLLAVLLRTASSSVSAYYALLHADLLHRAGLAADAATLLDQIGTAQAGDDATTAHAFLLRGDWLVPDGRHPETSGLPITASPPSGATERDLVAAEEAWSQAEAAYRFAGSSGGLASVRLRRATAPLPGTQPGQRRDNLLRAAGLARAAGHEAFARLCTVRLHIERFAAGEAPDPGPIEEVGTWASTDGSRSYARGLSRLLVAAAEEWRLTGDIVPARRALRNAEQLGAAVGATVDTDLVHGAVANLFGGGPYRLLSALLALAEVDTVAPPAAAPNLLAWAHAVERALTAYRDSNALGNPDLLQRVADVLRALLETTPTDLPAADPITEGLRTTLVAAVAEAATLTAWYRGRIALEAGLPDEAVSELSHAYALAQERNDNLLQAAILMTLDRKAEASAAANRAIATGLHPDLAASLLLRVGDAEGAAAALERIVDLPANGSGAERPWEAVGRLAEIRTALDDPAAGAILAERATTLFEERLSRLGRDVLRIESADDPTVARAYLAAVISYTALSERAEAAGDEVAAAAERDHAFDAADRPRAGLLSLAAAIRSVRADPAARQAVAGWLEAGADWAGHVERIANDLLAGPSSDPPQALRDRIDAGEAALADAEATLLSVAPDVLAARQGVSTPVAARVRSALPADTVLVEYHVLDEDLMIFAMTRSGLTHHRRHLRESDLAASVRRAHRACSTPGPWHGDIDLDRLAELLLAPVAPQIEDHRRVVVVPHRALTLLPWHLLPWDGDILGGRRTVSILPTARLAYAPGAGAPPELDRGTLVVGDPAYDPALGLQRLPGTRTEAFAVAGALDVDAPLVDDAATAAAVRKGAAGHAVLHFATHGLVDDRWPYLSQLALSGRDALTIGAMMALQVSADLVVLSACQTGQGRATAGGDFVGLARAALVSGARHLVVSLWPVDDEAGCLLAVAFAKRLEAGSHVAEAVQHASQEVREMNAPARSSAYESLRQAAASSPASPGRRGWPSEPVDRDQAAHPYFWAPFVTVGL
jgi:CHAT domain-containing protein